MNKLNKQKIITELFEGISDIELDSLLICLGAKFKEYKKDEMIMMTGDPTKYVGIVQTGQIQISRDDYYGNTSIITRLSKGELFGEVFVSAGIGKSPVNVTSLTASEVVFVEFDKISNSCSNICGCHSKLIENMLKIIAKRAMQQNFKIELLSQKGIRERVRLYLTRFIEKTGRQTFEIPFNRAQLAEYLCVDRSALSNELGKMRDEGVIKFNKNEFQIVGNLYEN